MPFSFKQKFFWTKKIIQSTNNSIGVILFRMGFFKEFNCDFKQIGTVKLNQNDIKTGLFAALVSSSSKNISPQGIEIAKLITSQKDNEVIDLGFIKLLNVTIYSFIDTFVEEQYSVETTDENRVIIDIGGNVGDSALYFANKGYEVYSFEPVPEVFNVALKNLELNDNLSNKINFINKAVTNKLGKIKLSFDGLDESGKSSVYVDSNNYVEVDTTTIAEILNDYKIEPYALKMDCEGCEYEIIGKTDLSMFSEILLEYHSNLTGINAGFLVEKLQDQGFKVKKIVGNDDMGLIHVYK